MYHLIWAQSDQRRTAFGLEPCTIKFHHTRNPTNFRGINRVPQLAKHPRLETADIQQEWLFIWNAQTRSIMLLSVSMFKALVIYLMFASVMAEFSLKFNTPGLRSQFHTTIEAPSQITIAIISTNDIHGTAFPTDMTRADTKQKYTHGGLVYMASLINIIRKQYGDNNTLWLDGGDQFQGGIQSSRLVSNGKIMNEFFNTQSLDAAAIGNHEFDYGPQFLNDYLKNNVESFVSANLYSEIDQPVTRFLPNAKRSKIIIMGNGVKVGIIGLTTIDTPQTSSGFTNHLFPDYQFKEYKDIVAQESKALRSNGAQIIVVLAHEGDECPGQSLDISIWRNTTTQIPCPLGRISQLVAELPAGTIDAVVQGHQHQIVHFYKNNIPIVGVTNGGYYFNVIYMTMDKKTRKIVDTSIEGPIPVCDRIFTKTSKCQYMSPDKLKDAGELTPWRFHNVTVTADPKLKTVFDEWKPFMAPYLEELVENQVYLKADDDHECALCNLFADLLYESVPRADFSLVNPGGLRTFWVPGMIQYQHFYNMCPFSNNVQTFNITGVQLKQMFTILQAGQRGFYSTRGLKMTVSTSPRALVNITQTSGFEIVDNRNYIGVTIDFLLNGGDDMEDVIGHVYTPRDVRTIGDFKALAKPLLRNKVIITQETCIDKLNPRLVVI